MGFILWKYEAQGIKHHLNMLHVLYSSTYSRRKHIKAFILMCTIFFTLQAQDTTVHAYKYYVDDSHTLNSHTAYQQHTQFIDATSTNTSLEFNQATIWMYMKVQNTSTKKTSNVIHLPYALHDSITYYTIEASHPVFQYTIGDLVPFNVRKMNNNDFAIPYILESNETKEILIKINSASSLNIGINFLSLQAYYEYTANNKLFIGLYYGAVFIMLFFSLVLYFMFREVIYLNFIMFNFSYFLLHFGVNGFAFQYLYPHDPWINNYYISIVFILVNYFALVFSSSFLDIKTIMPTLYKILCYLMRIFLLLLFFSFFIPYAFMIQMIGTFTIMTLALLFISGLMILVKYRTNASKFYFSTWILLVFLVMIFKYLQLHEIVIIPVFVLHGLDIIAFIGLLLLSFSLAYKHYLTFKKLTNTERALRHLTNDLETQVLKRTEELSLEVANKNIVFKELNHRVKNNLQIISGLLSLQARRLPKDNISKDILLESTQRIESIALIHEKLYQTDNLSAINMQVYSTQLVEHLQQCFQRKDLTFDIQCEHIFLSLEVAVPMGLIINELVINAIKYAFSQKKEQQKISIHMYTNDEDSFILEVYDNGQGMDMSKQVDGFGYKLIHALAVHQLQGKIETFNDHGLYHQITFSRKLLT